MPSGDDTLFSLAEQADPSHTGLVIVDLQNDFVHPDGWVAQEQLAGFFGDTGITDMLERAGALLAAARAAGIFTVFVRMIGDNRYLSGPIRAQYRRNHERERPTCVAEGSWGAGFFGDLRPDGREGEVIVDKHRYSAFIGTRMDLLLRSHGIRTVVVCGAATSGCVESTIRDAFMLDYYVITVGDACADDDVNRHRSTLTKMDLSFGTVVNVDDVARLWGASPPTPTGCSSDRNPSTTAASSGVGAGSTQR